eukprot:scaffold22839_cov171-Amphora_coffeaeformis.AAC.1
MITEDDKETNPPNHNNGTTSPKPLSIFESINDDATTTTTTLSSAIIIIIIIIRRRCRCPGKEDDCHGSGFCDAPWCSDRPTRTTTTAATANASFHNSSDVVKNEIVETSTTVRTKRRIIIVIPTPTTDHYDPDGTTPTRSTPRTSPSGHGSGLAHVGTVFIPGATEHWLRGRIYSPRRGCGRCPSSNYELFRAAQDFIKEGSHNAIRFYRPKPTSN